MTALYIILGIIAFFILLLSIKIQVDAEYFEDFKCSVRWLFIKVPIYPREKKEKKEKKPKEEKPPKKEKQKKKETTDKVKKPNPLKTFYENQGFDGVMKLLSDFMDATNKMMASLKKHFVFQELFLWITVSKNHDAAGTAIEYGQVCQYVFPALGAICSNFQVRKYDAEIEPDFLGSWNTAKFQVAISLRPIFLINAGIAFALRLLVKVVLKVIKSKPKTIKNKEIKKGGALQ